ncbi:MAG: DUF1015 domain-containing protein [Eubacteriales bacterium]|nr:DUF1015 domain-containing protein [Eubacteriales bacterium]
MNSLPIKAADILLPVEKYEKWSVVACDQFTSEPEYWKKTADIVGCSPSSLHLILPEIYLESDSGMRISEINKNMHKYLHEGIFKEYKNTMIYMERTLPGGAVRHGIVASIDLQAYDYRPEKKALIRATEGTVLERIPPRVKIRKDAPLELPHVMLLIDDPQKTVIEPLSASDLKVVYDFDLMMGGGHIKGYLIPEDKINKIFESLSALIGDEDDPLLFAVGDGNHSLATAKACYEADRNELSRYALAEIVNIHDDALVFEPIYRILTGIDPLDLYAAAKKALDRGGDIPVEYTASGISDIFYTDRFPVGPLQEFLDDYMSNHKSAKIDYIHGEDVLRRLATAAGSAGFIFDGMQKNGLFAAIKRDGALPRKSFSMGEAAGKRYYLEARLIKQ